MFHDMERTPQYSSADERRARHTQHGPEVLRLYRNLNGHEARRAISFLTTRLHDDLGHRDQ